MRHFHKPYARDAKTLALCTLDTMSLGLLIKMALEMPALVPISTSQGSQRHWTQAWGRFIVWSYAVRANHPGPLFRVASRMGHETSET